MKNIIKFTDHQSITSVTHIYKGEKSIEKAIEDIIVTHLKAEKNA